MSINNIKQYVDDLIKVHVVNIRDIIHKDRKLVNDVVTKISNIIDTIIPSIKTDIVDLLDQFEENTETTIGNFQSSINGQLETFQEGINSQLGGFSSSITSAMNAMSSIVPIGTIIAYWGINAPNGYLLCDGRNVVETTYPKLYAICGSSTPDLRGCFLRGLENGAANFRTKQEDATRKITGVIGEAIHAEMVAGSVYEYQNISTAKAYSSGSYRSSIIAIDSSKELGTDHTATEVRPMNYGISWCIKHD